MASNQGITVLHPAAEDTARRHVLAPRLSALKGTTVGLIDNHKRNADQPYRSALHRLDLRTGPIPR